MTRPDFKRNAAIPRDSKSPFPGSKRSNPDSKAQQIIAALAITVMCWTFGANNPWARAIFAGFCVAIFVAALLPSPKAFFRSTLRTGFFWGGLLVTLYILVQALNPSHVFRIDENLQRVKDPLDHITWLPSGVKAPWGKGSPWMHLAMISGTWLAFVGLRAGFKKRGSWIKLLWVAAINGSVVAFVGSLVKMTDSNKILWLFDSVNVSFFGTFYYKNHAAAFHYMVLAICGILFFYHLRKTQLKGLKSGPHLVCPLLGLLNLAAVYQTGSKGGMLLAGGIALVIVVTGAIHSWWLWREHNGSLTGLLAPAIFSVVLIGGGVFLVPTLVDFDNVESQISGLFEDIDAIQDAEVEQARSSNKSRLIAMTAFAEMLREVPFWGVGAGSFEHFSKEYSLRYPPIHYAYYDGRNQDWRTFLWMDAHSDWLEFPIEYGWLAFSVMVFTVACLVWEPLTHLGSFRLSWIPAIAGTGAFCVHAIWEFVFQAPTLVFFFAIVIASPMFLRRRA